MSSFILPPDYHRIKLVHSFEELVNSRFADGVNALCWQRTLAGDFEEVVAQLAAAEDGAGIDAIDEDELARLSLSAAGRVAASVLIEDLRLLREHGLEPSLDCIHGYARDDQAEGIATDVFSFHVDSAPVTADTYLCSYTEAPSEGLRNDEAQRHVDIAATRARLLGLYGKADDADFLDFLNDQCYDLHYAAAAHAQPFSFGLGNLWRIAIVCPGSPVPPCIHRAPATAPGQAPRLLLIS
jgi:hypothetical protein